MRLRTYYWTRRPPTLRGRIYAAAHLRRQPRRFRVGNAGDIFTKDLIDHVYGVEYRRVEDDGRRLLPMGSIIHYARQGDVLAGVGTKYHDIPGSSDLKVHVRAVRGPRTLEVLRQAGHNVSHLQSIGDPGLLISQMVPSRQPEPGRVVVLPHLSDQLRFRVLSPRWLTFVNIDGDPLSIGREIVSAEAVVTSSLHGIVFAHALKRPCLLIQPSTEPELKYRDYLEGVGVPWSEPFGDMRGLRPAHLPTEPAVLKVSAADLRFPTLDEAYELGVMEPDTEPIG